MNIRRPQDTSGGGADVIAALCAASALAGDVYVVRWGPRAVEYDRVATTATGDGLLVTWPDQPVEVIVLADLSDSIDGDEARRMGHTIETLHEELLERPQPGDRFGVIAFGGKTQRWVPLGPPDRPGLADWLARFGPPRTSWTAPVAFGDGPDALPAPPDPRALDRTETDAARALHAALEDLRATDPHALKAVVLLWDGGHNAWSALEPALDRAWAHEIHVFSVSFTMPDGPLVTRGGGDAFIAPETGPAVAERIVSELRF